MEFGAGPPPASRGQEHPWVSCSLPSAGEMLLPSGCLPTKHVFWSRFLAPAPGGSQGNAAKHVCAVAETAQWPGCSTEPRTVGASLAGDPAGWRGARAGDRNTVCCGGGGGVSAPGAGGDSPLTSTLIFITQLRYGADMKCGAGRGANKHSAGAGGGSIPRETRWVSSSSPLRCFLRLVDFDGGK